MISFYSSSCTFPLKTFSCGISRKWNYLENSPFFGFTKMAPGLMYCNNTKLCLSSEIIKPLSFLLGCCYSNLENQHDRVFKSHLYPQDVTLTCQAFRLWKEASLLSLKCICKSNASLMLPPEELWVDCGKGNPFSNHQCSQILLWFALFAEKLWLRKLATTNGRTENSPWIF